MDTAIRRKRSHDGQASLRRVELEEQLAELRDQEAELVRAIELVVADEKTQKLSTEQSLPLLGEKLTAEPKDYDLKMKLVGESKKRRAKTFWGEVRRVINALKNIKNLNSVFGVPVKETLWGSVPKHYEHYLSVISKPMDLRTIKGKLGDDEHGVQYTAPHEVADDIRLIAENCNKFNTGAQNEAVRKIAENLLQQFERKWRENSFEERWQKELAQQQHEAEELRELQTAANGGPVEKARYFERCTSRRLQSLSTGQPVGYKPFTWEQKRKLSQACAGIGEQACSAILSIVSECSQLPTEKNGVVSVRLDDLPDSILYRIQKRVEGAPKVEQEDTAQPAAPMHQAADAAAASSAPLQTGTDAPAKVAAPGVHSVGERDGKDPERGQEGADVAKDHMEEPIATDPAAGGSRPQSETGEPVLANGNAPADGARPAESRETQNSSSSGSDNSSSSSDDANSKGSSLNSDQGEGRNSGDSQQGESGAAATKDGSPREKHPSADGAETVLVSRNVPLEDEKPAPSILKAKDDSKEIQIENEADWAVPADDDNDDVQPMEEDIPANDQAKLAQDATLAQEVSPPDPAAQSKTEEDAPMNGVAQPAAKEAGGNQREDKPTDVSAPDDKPGGMNAYNAENDAIKDGSPSGKRKLDEALSDKEQADGEAQKKGSMGPVASPEAVNSTGVVGGEEN